MRRRVSKERRAANREKRRILALLSVVERSWSAFGTTDAAWQIRARAVEHVRRLIDQDMHR